MSNQLKRVNYSIFLDPVKSQSDRYAVGVLRQWVQERKELAINPTSGMELHRNLHMHKNIYLSGMYLYLLSPALCDLLATSLGDETVNIEMLKNQLRNCGLKLDSEQHAPMVDTDTLTAIKEASDNTPVMAELQSLKEQLADAFSIKEEESGQQASDVLLDELRQLRDDIAAQPKPVVAETGNLAGEIDALKQQLASEIRQLSMQREIAELKAMLTAQSSLIRNLSAGKVMPAESETPQEEAGEVLNQKMASVQKLKKKGIF